MKPYISIVMPAWNEQERIGETLASLHMARSKGSLQYDEIVVIDDGSTDRTADAASAYARVIRHPYNVGKGAALNTGWRNASGDIIVFLDADLGESAAHTGLLLKPVARASADMSIAKLPPAARKGGFGLVKGLASAGIHRLSGYRPEAPLSGQRALRREVLERIGSLAAGFGIEVGLTVDAARLGFSIVEVEVPYRHRETGRDLQGFMHRGRQFAAVGRALLHKWRNPVC